MFFFVILVAKYCLFCDAKADVLCKDCSSFLQSDRVYAFLCKECSRQVVLAWYKCDLYLLIGESNIDFEEFDTTSKSQKNILFIITYPGIEYKGRSTRANLVACN